MTTFFKIIRYKMYSYRVLYVTLQPKRWTFPISRVVYRGYNNANANGGVVNAYASSSASYAVADVGSRLAFHGKIVWAQSVSAFKAIIEVA